MKVSNKEVWLADKPLQELLGKRLPVVTSYKLAQLAHKLGNQLEIINGVKDGLVTKWGISQDGKFSISQESPNWPNFARELTELLELETEMVIEPVTLPDSLEIEAGLLINLFKFVKV